MVVIGKGSDPQRELRIDEIARDGVPVLRRGTGGCAVVLSPGTVVVSFVLFHRRQRNSSEYFQAFNAAIIRALGAMGVDDLEHKGTSDIARRRKKIAGTAIYRNRDLVFYHAVINLSESAVIMERYLQHPPRTPDYRNDRSHTEFVTSLSAEGFELDVDRFRMQIEHEFAGVRRRFGETAMESSVEEAGAA